MGTKQLTDLINHRLGIIKQDFNALPGGGGLEALRANLMNIMDKIGIFADEIDRLNGVKHPENALKKQAGATTGNELSLDPLGGA